MTRRAYGDVVAFEISQREAYADLRTVPVFRASGIFFARADDGVDTELTFLNYWSIKNDNDDVSLLLTVRDTDGHALTRDYVRIDGFVHTYRASELVDAPFEGSIELELHSSRDLKYAMPAIVVAYRTTDGVSFVHSNQRVFNDLSDLQRNIGFNSGQTGFDVRIDAATCSYVTFVNGPTAVEDATLRVALVNATGATLEHVVDVGRLPAYGSRRIDLDVVPGAAEHLDGQPGFARVDATTAGVFNRLAVGTRARDDSRATVTHSFYDCSTQADYLLASELPDEDYHAFLPLALVPGVDLEVVLYPIYCPSSFSIRLLSFDGAEDRELVLDGFDTRACRPARLAVSERLRAAYADADDLLHCLVFESDEGKLPARMTIGLNYAVDGFGSNVNDSVSLHSGYGVRDRLFAWGPVFLAEGARNVISVTHLEKHKAASGSAELHLRLYDETGIVLEQRHTMENRSALNLDVEALVQDLATSGTVLWYTIESTNPSFTVRQVHVSASGFVGADHSF